MQALVLTVSIIAVAACAALQGVSVPQDGDLPLPEGYRFWPAFLKEVQKPDAVRDLYINPVGARASKGDMFPQGTQFVMEIYSAKKASVGSFEKGPDGKLIKDKLTKIFVMGKDKGWGQDVPENFKTGAWVYSAYTGEGKPLAANFTECRACHVPLAQKDFFHRYDEYFETRAAR
jgi:hemoglobin